jgi:predicted RND superfamily exporter protein
MSRLEALVGRIQRNGRGLVVLLCLMSVAAVVGASRVGVDNAVDIWFPDNAPALQAYRAFQKDFGNDEVVVIGLHVPEGVATAPGLAELRAVTKAAGAVEGVAKARSLVNSSSIRGGLGTLEVGPVVGEQAAPGDASRIRNAVATDPLMRQLLSKDGKTTVVLAQMEAMDDIDARRDAILADLREALRDHEVRFGGIGVIYAALNQASTQGAAGIMAASYLLILALLWWLLGRWRPVILTLGVVGLGALWLLGLYGASGRDINMVTMVMPTLVLVIGVSDCVHMLVHTAVEGEDLDPEARVRRGVGQVLWPCLINTLTTSMGFLALMAASMPVIRDLGLFSALGLMAAFICAVVVCTLVAGRPGFSPRLRPSGLVQRGVDAMAALAVGRPWRVLFVAALVGLVAAMGVTRIVVDTYSIDFLRADHPVRVDSDRLEADYGPYTPLEFIVERPLGVKDPGTLASIAAWQAEMEATPEVGWTRSPADVVVRLDAVMSGQKTGRVPSDDVALAQLLFLYESDPEADMGRFIDSSGTRARVTVGVDMDSARGFDTRIQALSALANLPPDTTLTPAGYLPLYVRIMHHIVGSQLRSFGLAFAIIFVLIGVLFRSLRMAILAIPANLLPVLCTLGLMGLVGVRLDVATVTIAAIVLGLVVDDTVQFLYRYQVESSQTDDTVEAVFRTVRRVGQPMAITTVVLAGGFAVLGLATIKSVAWFGLLLATALITALFSDLLVVPALIVLTSRRSYSSNDSLGK